MEDAFNVINLGDKKIMCLKRGIQLLEVDAIVNAANETLRGGSGVDGVIHRFAGPQLREECMEKYPDGCDVGDAKITGGHKLPAKYIIHTVGPQLHPVTDQPQPVLLAKCYVNSLKLADLWKLETIAFPCISTGIYAFPRPLAARIAYQSVKMWLEKNPQSSVKTVIFALTEDDQEKLYRQTVV